MWSNFFLQEEERRRAGRGRGARARGAGRGGPGVRRALLLSALGAALAVLAVSTEFWVELRPRGDNGSCQAAHLGLWKACTRRRSLSHPAGDACRPAELPREANCTYFRFFTTGENAHIFQRTTKKELNLAAAVVAVLALLAMVLGGLCITMVLSKGADFLLRVGAACFGLSGLLLLLSLELFRHSVLALLLRVDPGPPVPALAHQFSWSLGCGVAGGVTLLLGAVCFLLLSLPPWPWASLCPQRGPRAA
ncbi:voltage-dependent calcium channel gamma-6 subunit [Erinaceus europaeus]|uniref:Voltage-dependent calcium channel gamma-6 subunit n=1 Tax=Erinaceus europaeus TaxID=9365 RepID=A0ABM3VWK7_ERIEU|nr:voltage-dependent calcium channel gamma-6 subunit [Erinaceus europaeus]